MTTDGTDPENGEASPTMLEDLEDPDDGPEIWFILALVGIIGVVVVTLGFLILWLIGMAQTPSPLLR
jgi:hypothetical protein